MEETKVKTCPLCGNEIKLPRVYVLVNICGKASVALTEYEECQIEIARMAVKCLNSGSGGNTFFVGNKEGKEL